MNDAPRTVILVGFRACGKTSLGRLLAAHLSRPFFDLDGEIEQSLGRSIPEIFRDDGEAWFRQVESEMLAGILARPGIVLAPGGGAVLRAENRDLLERMGFVIYLCVPEADLIHRLQGAVGRPRLTDRPTLEEEVATLLERRDRLYREVAERVLEVGVGETQDETFRRLLGICGEAGGAGGPGTGPEDRAD